MCCPTSIAASAPALRHRPEHEPVHLASVVLDIDVRPVDRRLPTDPVDPLVTRDHHTFGKDPSGEPKRRLLEVHDIDGPLQSHFELAAEA
jgi:hypothetical protein